LLRQTLRSSSAGRTISALTQLTPCSDKNVNPCNTQVVYQE
jgi:hypothetical protein